MLTRDAVTLTTYESDSNVVYEGGCHLDRYELKLFEFAEPGSKGVENGSNLLHFRCFMVIGTGHPNTLWQL